MQSISKLPRQPKFNLPVDKETEEIIKGIYNSDEIFTEKFDEDRNGLIDDNGVLILPAQIEIEEEYNFYECIKPATLEALNKEQPKIISQEPPTITSKLTTIDQSTTLQVDTSNVRACSRTI